MTDNSARGVKDLVNRLELHLHVEEREFCKVLQITPEITDEALDKLFLSDTFDRFKLLKHLSVTNIKIPDVSSKRATHTTFDQEDLQDFYLKQVEQATKRVKNYLEVLTNQIVKIVEKESDSFMDVASKLDGFRQILTDLKDSHTDFHQNFVSEKAKTDQVYGYLLEKQAVLQEMINERNELKMLVELQNLFNQVHDRVNLALGE